MGELWSSSTISDPREACTCNSDTTPVSPIRELLSGPYLNTIIGKWELRGGHSSLLRGYKYPS